MPKMFKFLLFKKHGRLISWSLFLSSKIYWFLFLKFCIKRDMESLVHDFQKLVINDLSYDIPDILIGYDGCSKLVFEKFKGKSNLVLDFTTILDEYNFVINPKSYTDRISYLQTDFNKSAYFQNKKAELNLADLILVPSNQVRQSILYSFSFLDYKIFQVNYGYDEKIFFREKVNHYRKNVRFIFIGTLSFHKGSDLLFSVWKKILTLNLDIELHICGHCNHEFINFISLDKVFYHGFVSQKKLSRIINSSDILVYPTFVDGFSLSVLQSMVCGLSLITTSNCGISLINDFNGKVINVGSESELFSSMVQLAQDLNLNIYFGNNNYLKFKKYTWSFYAFNLHRELLNRFS